MKTNVRCPICDSVDKWENVDHLRMNPYKNQEKKIPHNMSICVECGFVTYPDMLDKKALDEYYAKDYRNPPNFGNLATGNTKLWYHSAFLAELTTKWQVEETDLDIFEVGAAMGMVCDWFKKGFPKARVQGSEKTPSFIKVAKHHYGIDLIDEIDTSKKYDLVMSYKVAEHQIDPDLEIKKYADCLKDDGYLYIGVPCWFDKMTNFGVAGFDLEYYYHPAHINVWTRKSFESLLTKAGLVVVKENHTYYDSVYLCKKGKVEHKVHKEDPVKIKEIMGRVKKSFELVNIQKFKEALEVFPYYPQAWHGYYEINRNQFHQEGFKAIEDKIINPMLELMPNDHSCLTLAADIHMRYGKYDKAIELASKLLDNQPYSAIAFRLIGIALREMAKHDKKYWKQSADIELKRLQAHPAEKQDAIQWLFYSYAQMED